MLTTYVEASLDHAVFEWLAEDGQWYGEIPEFPGVWATGVDKDACRRELHSVLENWILLSIYDHDPLPPIDGIELIVRQVA